MGNGLYFRVVYFPFITDQIKPVILILSSFSDLEEVIAKELQVGVANGIISGIVMAIVAYYWKGAPVLGLVLMLSIIGNLFIAALVGTLIPLGLKAIKIDPAVASAVIVTTFTDCFGFFSFLGLATLLVKYLT